jgi:hypothetical protein
MANGVSLLSVKRPGREADHSLPPGVEVNNDEAITHLSHTSPWCGV